MSIQLSEFSPVRPGMSFSLTVPVLVRGGLVFVKRCECPDALSSRGVFQTSHLDFRLSV